MKIDIFINPQEHSVGAVEDGTMRLLYNNQWVFFKDGDVFVSQNAKEVSCMPNKDKTGPPKNSGGPKDGSGGGKGRAGKRPAAGKGTGKKKGGKKGKC